MAADARPVLINYFSPAYELAVIRAARSLCYAVDNRKRDQAMSKKLTDPRERALARRALLIANHHIADLRTTLIEAALGVTP